VCVCVRACEGIMLWVLLVSFVDVNHNRCFPTSLRKYEGVCLCVCVCVCVCVWQRPLAAQTIKTRFLSFCHLNQWPQHNCLWNNRPRPHIKKITSKHTYTFMWHTHTHTHTQTELHMLNPAGGSSLVAGEDQTGLFESAWCHVLFSLSVWWPHKTFKWCRVWGFRQVLLTFWIIFTRTKPKTNSYQITIILVQRQTLVCVWDSQMG